MPFDPYHQWLGIPPAEQPPNHYRLLGIAVFESNPDVISNAADRQMAHARTFQLGKNAADSQRLLSEIATARACLLNDDARADYDLTLQVASAEPVPPPNVAGIANAAPAVPEPAIAAPAIAAPAVAAPAILEPTASAAAIVVPVKRRRRTRSPRQAIALTTAAVVIALGSLLAAVSLLRSRQQDVERRAAASTLGAALKAPSKTAAEVASTLGGPVDPPVSAGAGLELDGKAWLETNLQYDGRTPLTIEVWVTPAASSRQSIVANNHGLGLTLGIGKDGHFGYWVRDQRDYRGAISNEVVRPGERVHVAGVFDDRLVRLFVDGQLQDTTGTLTSRHKVSNLRFMIGADPDFHSHPQTHFQGIVHSVHVSQDVVYEDSFTPPVTFVKTPSTVLLLQLDEGQGEVAWDKSGHETHAKLHAAKWVAASTKPLAPPGYE